MQLIQRIKRVNKKVAETDHVLDLAEHRQLLTVAAYILQESHWVKQSVCMGMHLFVSAIISVSVYTDIQM